MNTSTDRGQREVSAILLSLMGWKEFSPGVFYRSDQKGNWEFVGNLYERAAMHVAWEALNWANKQTFKSAETLDQQPGWRNFVADLRSLPPAQAQKAWLDEIALLVMEAGYG